MEIKCPSCNAIMSEISINEVNLYKCETEDKYFDVEDGKATEINKKWYMALAGKKLDDSDDITKLLKE